MEPLSYNHWQTQLIFPFKATEIESIVQAKFCLGMEKLKKEKLFGGKFLSFLWL